MAGGAVSGHRGESDPDLGGALNFDFLFSNLPELTITGLALGAIYALVALGYTMVYGVLQLINFAHSEVFMFGGFAAVWTLYAFGATPATSTAAIIGYMLVALVVAMLVSGGVAVGLERLAYRPLIVRGSPKLVVLISAIGASFVLSEAMGLRNLLFQRLPAIVVAVLIGVVFAAIIVFAVAGASHVVAVEGSEPRRFKVSEVPRFMPLLVGIALAFLVSDWAGIGSKVNDKIDVYGPLKTYLARARESAALPINVNPKTVLHIGNYGVTTIDILLIGSALLMMLVLDQFIRRSRTGRGIRAVAQDPQAAALMGVNRNRVVQITFLIGGLMAGVAALLYVTKIGSIRFNDGFLLGVKAFTAAVMGGIGNLRGALLGGLVLGVAENWGSAVFGSDWKDVVAFVLLVLILLFRPTGLLGEALGKARA